MREGSGEKGQYLQLADLSRRLHSGDIGLGFRPPWFGNLMALEPRSPGWLEIISENYLAMGGRPFAHLEALRGRFPIAMHGVAMGIGSREPLDVAYLKRLRTLSEWLAAPIVSDHLCWTTAPVSSVPPVGSTSDDASIWTHSSHDLLPLRYSRGELERVADRVRAVQDVLGCRLHLENPSAYVEFAPREMSEVEFLAEIVQRTGCGVLLDLNNLFVNQCNLGLDAAKGLSAFRADDVGYFHLAGHTIEDGVRIDTHDQLVCASVWELYRTAVRRFPEVPVLLEWDASLPEFTVLQGEIARAREIRESVWGRVEVIAPKPADPVLLRPRPAPGAGQGFVPDPTSGDHVLMRRFFDFVADPAGCSVEVDMERSPDEPSQNSVDEFVVANLPTPAGRGLGVYRHAYGARLVEVLGNIFPALKSLCGDTWWEPVARDYLADCPPRGRSVRDVGVRLADWIATRAPHDFGIPAAHVAALARLEWERELLFDQQPAAGEPLVDAALQAIAESDWDRVVFPASGLVRVLALPIDAEALSRTLLTEGTPRRRPEARATWHLLRRDHSGEVQTDILDADAGRAAAAILSGKPFGAVCAEVAGKEEPETAVARVLPVLVRLMHASGLMCPSLS